MTDNSEQYSGAAVIVIVINLITPTHLIIIAQVRAVARGHTNLG